VGFFGVGFFGGCTQNKILHYLVGETTKPTGVLMGVRTRVSEPCKEPKTSPTDAITKLEMRLQPGTPPGHLQLSPDFLAGSLERCRGEESNPLW